MRTRASTKLGRGIGGNNRAGAVDRAKPFKVPSTYDPDTLAQARRTARYDPLAPSLQAKKLVGRLFKRAGHPPTYFYVAKAEGKAVIVRDDYTEERLLATAFMNRVKGPNWSEVEMERK